MDALLIVWFHITTVYIHDIISSSTDNDDNTKNDLYIYIHTLWMFSTFFVRFHFMSLPFTWRSWAQRSVGARHRQRFHPFVCVCGASMLQILSGFLRRKKWVRGNHLLSPYVYIYIQYTYVICSYFWVSWNPTWSGVTTYLHYDFFLDHLEPTKTGCLIHAKEWMYYSLL